MTGAMEQPLLGRVACVDARPQPPERLASRAAEAGCRVLEARLDLLGYTREETRRLLEEASSRGLRVIATLRCAAEGGRWAGSPREKLDRLLHAAEHGAWLVDVEYRSPVLDEALASLPGRVLASIHLDHTPWPEILYSYAGDMIRRGARIAKIVTTARTLGDNWRVLGVNARWPGRAAAFAMGPRGRLSRVIAPLMGGALTYASIGEASAPGQLSLAELLEAWRLLGALQPRAARSPPSPSA